MKYPVKWLKDYVDIEVSPVELGNALNLSGSHLEEVIETGAEITNVVTGKIVKIEQHPDAEKLVVCEVDINREEPIQIVTAATNMKEQDIVPVALHGSTLHGGLKIKKGKLRGVMSQGMFCSEEELGIAGDEPVVGLMILPEDTAIGVDIKTVVPMESAIIDLEITSNRADCFSMIGIARETAATFGTEYRMPNLEYTEKDDRDINDSYKVEVRSSLCRRYMAKAITNIKIEPSPQWMQERLLEADIRPINNMVDITNFVMMELGQPLHAFDARDIETNTLVIEEAKDGEKFVTLDGEERTLDSSMLCIKDGEKTVALAGVMGGLNSEVKDDTSMIIIESANFNGVNIRNTSKKIGLRTEASGKYEKDLDPNLCEIAVKRVCALVEELGAGTVMKGQIDVYNEKREPHTLTVNADWINRFLGTDISKREMKRYLDGLDLTTEIEGDNLVVFCPTFRSDLNIKEDIAEEVARIYGYNNIPSTLPQCKATKSGKSHKQILEERVKTAMVASGYNESISYTFTSDKVFDKLLIPADSELRNTVVIRNPLGEDYKNMRTTTIGSMMESLARNYNRNNEIAALYEVGRVYIKNEDENKIPEERNILTIGMYGAGDFLELKGVVENVLEHLGIENAVYARESENPTFHPGKTAALKLRNKAVGVFGEIHPDVAENYGLDERCFVAEINLDKVFECAKLDKKYSQLPKFPAVTRDLAVLVDDLVLVQEIEEIIKRQGGNILESAKLFDIYKGSQIPEGKKSVAYALVYRNAERTLTDSDVNKVHEKILRTLENKLGAELR